MNSNTKTGVFLCKCGDEIQPRIDLDLLKKDIEPQAQWVEILPNPCLKPGLDAIQTRVEEQGVDRIIVAGCDGRIMLKKFETALEPLGLLKGQIDMVNLKNHVAKVALATPEEKAQKSAKLIRAAIAEMEVLAPTQKRPVALNGPVALVGKGMGAFPAAGKLLDAGVECILTVDSADSNAIMAAARRAYPGEYQQYDRMKRLVEGVLSHEKATIVENMELKNLLGITGRFTLDMEDAQGEKKSLEAGLVVAALDATLSAPGPEFGYDGQGVVILPELDAAMAENGIPRGDVVFWISDYEYGTPEFATLSARSAWNTARHIKDAWPHTRVSIICHQDMALPLNAAERGLSRNLGVEWISYDKAVRPAVQDGFITFCNTRDHLEHELDWDHLVLSSCRSLGEETRDVARTLGVLHGAQGFLSGHHTHVKP
ncbi:MAG: hypothetical protein MI749_11515, partial [Desulfovibrionales bacterium]|nr:hypothetical protein [Desulfovibrionales bacterium]